jgi:hypothetical protein
VDNSWIASLLRLVSSSRVSPALSPCRLILPYFASDSVHECPCLLARLVWVIFTQLSQRLVSEAPIFNYDDMNSSNIILPLNIRYTHNTYRQNSSNIILLLNIRYTHNTYRQISSLLARSVVYHFRQLVYLRQFSERESHGEPAQCACHCVSRIE